MNCALAAPAAAQTESGQQVIQGTRVFTVVDHGRKVATFSNDCGTQVLTQRQLQAGAIPNNIIPCPRPGQRPSPRPSTRDTSADDDDDAPVRQPQRSRRTYWGALAAGIDDGFFNKRVGAGSALNHTSADDASEAALDKCRESSSNCRVVGTFTGCGYVTVSDGGDGVAWGSGGTEQEAINQCEKHGYPCKPPIGGCNEN